MRSCDSFKRRSKLESNMSHQNLQGLNNIKPKPYAFSKPITYSNLCPHRHHKRNCVPRNNEKIIQTQQKGIIFIWPQKRKFYYQKELKLLLRFIAHSLYWLHVGNLFPCGAGILINIFFLNVVRYIFF